MPGTITGGQGFRIVDVMRFDGKTYDSAIPSKTPIAVRTLAACDIVNGQSRFTIVRIPIDCNPVAST